MIFAVFDGEGFPTAFYNSLLHGERYIDVVGEDGSVIGREPNPDTTIPAKAIEISEAQYAELLAQEGRRRWDGEKVVPYDPPAVPPPPIVLQADTLFFERMTDAEYDALDASVRSGESARVYRGWAAATSFTEGTDLWALLVKHLDEIGTTASRRAELLARP